MAEEAVLTGKHKIIGLLLLCILLMSALACENKTQNPPEPEPDTTIWFSDPDSYRTNVLDVAQAETPFTIVLPTYVPNDIIPFPYIEGLAKSDFRDDLPVRIMYYRARYVSSPIYIEESQGAREIIPSSDSATHLTISGIGVVEDESLQISATDIETLSPVPCLMYSRNRDDIHYRVVIFIYQRDEARKIVESMINQN
jgi:hypothetical protein